MSEKRLALGRKGEELAVSALGRKGFRILARNYRRPFGEIDIIARDGNCVAFVEVKTRRAAGAYTPAEAVTRRKQVQIARVAQEYLAANRLLDTPSRFDVVTVVIEADGRHRIEHFADAFNLPESFF
ncbi:MAG: YraN family protein [Desulfobulbaceae bacterium]|nr:MAG: YraN family protein [Desulfobulbaceae bacterium]